MSMEQSTRDYDENEVKPGEDTLLESIRGLLGKIKTANVSLTTIENRLESCGAKNDDTKLAHSDVRTYLTECHAEMDDLEDRLCRIVGVLGE